MTQRPTKFDLMRRNRRTLAAARLRDVARDLGYDETEENEKLLSDAQRELDALRVPSSVVFGRKPQRPQRRGLFMRVFNYAMGLGPDA